MSESMLDFLPESQAPTNYEVSMYELEPGDYLAAKAEIDRLGLRFAQYREVHAALEAEHELVKRRYVVERRKLYFFAALFLLTWAARIIEELT